MSPPQLRGEVIIGVIAGRRGVFGVLRQLKPERAGELAAKRFPAAGGWSRRGRYGAAGPALRCLRGAAGRGWAATAPPG